MAEAPDDAVDRLYGLPREEFVVERDALAKQLRADGRRDEAAAIKALAKPTVAAWAANQAVRSQKRAARDLWKAGDALSAAQDAVLAGKGSGAKLREANERERAAVETLVDAARGLLGASGGDLSETTIERVRQTLHAGAIDAEARDEVAAGRAARERSPQGLFGADPFAAPAPKRAAKGEPEARRTPKAKPDRSAGRPSVAAGATTPPRTSASARRPPSASARRPRPASASAKRPPPVSASARRRRAGWTRPAAPSSRRRSARPRPPSASTRRRRARARPPTRWRPPRPSCARSSAARPRAGARPA